LDFQLGSLELLKSGKDITLKDGDMLSIFPINKTRRGFVSISGNVSMPGEYELSTGLNLKELLKKAGGVLPGTYMQRGEIIRYVDEKTKEIIAFDMDKLLKGEVAENYDLKEWDQVISYSLYNVLPVQTVQISGAVNREGKLELASKMKISDVIFRSGGLKPTALLENAELYHMAAGKDPEILKINLKRILIDKDAAFDMLLEGGDHLFVREDSSSARKKRVTLTGEFKYPGVYVAEYEEKLSSVIQRAGGFSEKAFLPGAVFKRESVRTAQQKAVTSYLERLQTEVFSEAANMADTSAKRAAEIMKNKEDLAKIYAAFEVPGRLIIKIEDMKTFTDSIYDILLEDNDALFIPQKPSSVNVIGSVYNSSSLVYEPNKNLSYYLDKVGGTTRDANRGDVYIISAGGEVNKNNAWGRDLERGDTVVVPAEITIGTNWFKMLLDASQIFYQVGVGASAIRR
jgi:protein involved in polysaccharide export with SLBB domain